MEMTWQRPSPDAYADSFANATIAIVNYRVRISFEMSGVSLDRAASESVLVKTRPRTHALVEELGMLISKTRKMVFATATRRLDESGESMLAWQVLALLIRAGKRTQTEVAVALA